MRSPLSALAAVLVLLLAACGGADEGALDVGIIDAPDAVFSDGVRLSPGGQHLRAALRTGLVALDQQGEVVPALADRWNVTDGGRIFVFRLRDGTWPDGSELTAESVRIALNNALRQLRGTSLGLDLAPVTEVRAMAGRVVEIRLSSTVPDLLLLLAQPELGLRRGEGETGPMRLVDAGDGESDGSGTAGDAAALLVMKSPEMRGLPEREDWQDDVRTVRLAALDAAEAMTRFDNGELAVVLGGRLGELPLADTGPLSRGTVRLDPAVGLFGLQVRRARGVLASEEVREGIAMALDRAALLSQFNIGGWTPTTRVVPPGLGDDPGLVPERWVGQPIEELRNTAAARVRRWVAAQEEVTPEDTRLTIMIGDAPGLDMLLRELSSQLAAMGITLVRTSERSEADLVLVDRVARYAAPRWFLNQFNCSLNQGLCSEEADALVRQALEATDTAQRAYLLAEAEAQLTLANVYIPIGPPIRWSLVRGNVGGYAPNRWAFHPLSDMAVIPR